MKINCYESRDNSGIPYFVSIWSQITVLSINTAVQCKTIELYNYNSSPSIIVHMCMTFIVPSDLKEALFIVYLI